MGEQPKIYYAKPSITDLEVQYVTDAAANGWGDACYDYIDRFEKTFGAYIGSSYTVATSSCTGALHLGLAALGVGSGDEVILADAGWIASVAPVVHLGALPVFVDILPNTWCLDPEAVRKAITPKTKAIIAVHLYGNLCDIDALEEIAAEYGIYLIEDAAEAIGSRWGTRYAGSRGVFGVFSFHGTKTMTTGEGGMLVTNDLPLATTVRILNNHGRGPKDKQFQPSLLGYKFKISNMAAALGCAQVERLPELLSRRNEIFRKYVDLLSDLPGIGMNIEVDGTTNGFWMPTLVLPSELGSVRDRILASFVLNSIDGRVFFSPLSSLPMFVPCPGNKNSYALAQRGVNLPCYHDLTDADIRRITDIIHTEYAYGRQCLENGSE